MFLELMYIDGLTDVVSVYKKKKHKKFSIVQSTTHKTFNICVLKLQSPKVDLDLKKNRISRAMGHALFPKNIFFLNLEHYTQI